MSQASVELHVDERGAGDALLLLHGFGASGFAWRHWVPLLARHHRVLVADLKGFGRSPAPRDGRYSPHDHADAVHEFVRERDLRRLTLVGHSLGGGVALLTALRLADAGALDRVRALVLVSSVAFPQPVPPFIGLARRSPLGVVDRLGRLPPRHLVRLVLRAIVFDRTCVTREMVEGYARPLASPDARYALVRTARQLVPPDLDSVVGRYRDLDVPVRLVWGRDDRVVPVWVARRLAETLPRARLEVLDGCGHLPAEELPDASLAGVMGFLEELD